MNPRIKQLWVNALRSGTYTQGSGELRRHIPSTEEPLYCCLGVLCELHRLETGAGDWDEFDGYVPVDTWADSRELPRAVSVWAGLRDDEGFLIFDPQGFETTNPNADDSLAGLNDRGWSFEEIADLIEAAL